MHSRQSGYIKNIKYFKYGKQIVPKTAPTIISQSMNERDKLRIYGLPKPKSTDINKPTPEDITFEVDFNKIHNNKIKNLSLDYNKSICNMVGIIIVNLNQLKLTKNCIDDLKKQINQNFKIYLFDQNSSEIGTAEYLDECIKDNILVYKNTENVPLNYIWNNFKNICDYEYLCFLNNDVELSNTFIDDTIKILNNESTVGSVIHVTNNPYYLQSKNTLEYKIFNEMPLYQGWDFTLRRSIIPEIPRALQIFGGDDYIFAKINTMGYKIAIAYSSPIIHYKEKTRVNIPNIGIIQRNDALNFSELIRNERLRQIDSTMNHGISQKFPLPDMKLTLNKNCVFTAIIGDYDSLTSTTYPKLPDWDYICFTDNANIKSDFWIVIYINNEIKGYVENIKLARYYKTNFYKHLSSYENLMWIDARITIINNINEYLKNLEGNDIVFLKHPDASSILHEFNRVVSGKIERQEMIDIIKQRYVEVGYNYDNGLISSGVMLFKNNKKNIKFFTEWWYEIENYSHRDQLSGNFVLWKNPDIKYIMLQGMINKYFKQLPRNTQTFRYE
jgi:hypothetical protein